MQGQAPPNNDKQILKRPTRRITKQDIKLAQARTQGLSTRQIAPLIGKDKATVARRLSKPEIKALVEQMQEQLIAEDVPRAVDNIRYAIKGYQDKDSDTLLREHGYKASNRLMEMVGILPSHTPSVVYQQIVAQGDVHINQDLGVLGSFIGDKMSQLEDVEVIDVTPMGAFLGASPDSQGSNE